MYFSYFRTRPSLSSTCVIPGNPSVSSFYIIPGRGPHLAPLVLSLDTQPPFSHSHSTNLHPLALFQTHPSIQLLSSVVLFQHKLFIHSAPLTLFQNTLSLSTQIRFDIFLFSNICIFSRYSLSTTLRQHYYSTLFFHSAPNCTYYSLKQSPVGYIFIFQDTQTFFPASFIVHIILKPILQ